MGYGISAEGEKKIATHLEILSGKADWRDPPCYYLAKEGVKWGGRLVETPARCVQLFVSHRGLHPRH